MSHTVVIHRSAYEGIRSIYDWAARQAPQTAERWYERFRDRIKSLQVSPERCPKAFESVAYGIDVRELLFGRKPNVVRVLFIIDGEYVRVFAMRRAARGHMTRHELEQALDETGDSD